MTLEALAQARITDNLPTFQTSAAKVFSTTPLSQAWISSYTAISGGNPALPLLFGAKIALFETAASWSIGLNRGAVASLRTFLENAFAWLYYKDHPVEYSLVERREDDLMLPKAIRGYASKVDKGFDAAASMLFKVAARTDDYYYTNISGYIHAHPAGVVGGKGVVDAVICHPPDPAFLDICKYADEFASDLYLARYRFHWDTIPEVVQANAQARFGEKNLAKFLAM